MWYLDGTSPPLLIKIFIFILASLLIWLMGFLIKQNLDRVSQRRNFEAKNAIKLTTSLAQILALGILGTIIFEIDTTTVLSLSALLGTTIGFATSIVVGNVVAGFYLISVRPFGIGDLIQVKGTEGIVMEIGLNYTKLMLLDESFVLIPNKSLLDANLINCTITIDELKERASMGHEISYNQLMEELGEHESHSLREQLSEEIASRKVVRYPFTLQLKLNIVSPDIKLSDVRERMDDLLVVWEEKLGFRPRYYFNKYVFRQDMRVILVMDRSEQILDVFTPFVEEVYRTVFTELQEVDA